MTLRPGNLRIRFLMVLVGHRYPATVVIGAALFLGGCATPRTVATAQTPEPIVERWRGLTVAAEHRCSPYRSDEYAYPQAVEAAGKRRTQDQHTALSLHRFGERTTSGQERKK